MKPLSIADVRIYAEAKIGDFHSTRLQRLEGLSLNKILKRKTPYLFKANYILTAQDLVKTLPDAYPSSQEETIFGCPLEGLAIFACRQVHDGRKSTAEGIDLEFEKDSVRYFVPIKSGQNWGDCSQIAGMKDKFTKAKQILRTNNSTLQIVAVNGCCYGQDNKPDKDDYFKYCGQRFCEFISGTNELYVQIIKPLGHKSKAKNENFVRAYSQIINKCTLAFGGQFCTEDERIDWDTSVQFKSSAPSMKT